MDTVLQDGSQDRTPHPQHPWGRPGHTHTRRYGPEAGQLTQKQVAKKVHLNRLRCRVDEHIFYAGVAARVSLFGRLQG